MTLRDRRYLAALPQGALLLILAVCAMATQAAPVIGRLFTSPQERAALEAQRRSGAAPATPAPASVDAAEPAPQTVTMNGIVRRSAGQATVWINQQPHQVADPANRQPAAGLTLRAPGVAPVRLKPGQRYDRTSGVVGEDDGR